MKKSIFVFLFFFTICSVNSFAEYNEIDFDESKSYINETNDKKKYDYIIQKQTPKPDNVSKNYYDREKGIESEDDNTVYPNIKYKLLAEYYINSLNNKKYKISNNDAKTDGQLRLNSYFRLNFNKNFYFGTNWYLKPVNKRVYDNDIYAKNYSNLIADFTNNDFYGKQDYIQRKFHWNDYGLGVETLELGFISTNIKISGGKIHPNFGFAFKKDRFSGIYGTKLPEEYELKEKIGGSIAGLFPFGNITFSMFMNDSTKLSDTAFEKIGKYDSEYGLGYTNKIKNFSISYDLKLKKLSFNIAYRALYNNGYNNYYDYYYYNYYNSIYSMIYTDSYHKNYLFNLYNDFTDGRYAEHLLAPYNFKKKEIKESGFVSGIEYQFDFPYEITFKPLIEYAYFNNYNGMSDRKVHYITGYLPFFFENWHLIFSNTSKYDIENNYKNVSSYLAQISFGYKFDSGIMIDFAKIWNINYYKAEGFSTLWYREKYRTKQHSIAFMISYLLKI